MEVGEFRRKASEMGFPAKIIDEEVAYYLQCLKNDSELVVTLEERLLMFQVIWSNGYIEPQGDPPYGGSR